MGITPHPSSRVEVNEEKSGKKEQKEVTKNDSGIKRVKKKMSKKKEKLV